MSDLRERIAAVLKAAITDDFAGCCSVQYDDLIYVDGSINAHDLADAVISELDSRGLLIDSEAGERLRKIREAGGRR